MPYFIRGIILCLIVRRHAVPSKQRRVHIHMPSQSTIALDKMARTIPTIFSERDKCLLAFWTEDFGQVERFSFDIGTGGLGGRHAAAHFRLLLVSWGIVGSAEDIGRLVSQE